MVKLYPWQEGLYAKWVAAGRKGIVRAVPGAGKTIAGCEVIRRSGLEKVVVVVPTRALKEQWIQVLNQQNVKADVMTYSTACRHGNGGIIDLLILDECHRADGPKFRNVYRNFEYRAMLSMSATPSELNYKICGPVLEDVWFDRAKVSPFKVHYIKVAMNAEEWDEYEELTEKLRNMYRVRDGVYSRGRMPTGISGAERGEWVHDFWDLEKAIQWTILRRRDLVYRLKSRLPKAKELIMRLRSEDHKERILIVCQRVFQVEQLYELLEAEYPGDVAQYHSRHSDPQEVIDFKSGEKRIMLSVKALNEGFDVPEIDAAVVVSTTLNPSRHIQTIGRAARWMPGKKADVYVLIGQDTGDERLPGVENEPRPLPPDPRVRELEVAALFGQFWRRVEEEVLPW